MRQQKSFVFTHISPFLKGVGQIMLQDNAWAGLFFLAGIGCGSFMMGFAAIIAVITGTCTAKLLKYDKEEIAKGLYGFSAALVGVALICFFEPTIVVCGAIIAGSVLATMVQHLFIIKKIPAFTFPFILVTWVLLFVFHYFPALVPPQPEVAGTYPNDNFALLSRGFGQVIFQSNIWAGLLFAIGVFISRPIAAFYAIAGIVLSSIMAHLLKEPVNDIYLGLFSYNAVLCAITFAGKKAEDFLMALISVVLSVLIIIQMRYLNLPALTFPFVLATWLTLTIKIAKQSVHLKLKQ